MYRRNYLKKTKYQIKKINQEHSSTTSSKKKKKQQPHYRKTKKGIMNVNTVA
jgi:hypothetical protein